VNPVADEFPMKIFELPTVVGVPAELVPIPIAITFPPPNTLEPEPPPMNTLFEILLEPYPVLAPKNRELATLLELQPDVVPINEELHMALPFCTEPNPKDSMLVELDNPRPAFTPIIVFDAFEFARNPAFVAVELPIYIFELLSPTCS
jgi:hypothetical protein